MGLTSGNMHENWQVIGAQRTADAGFWQGEHEPSLLLSSGRDVAWEWVELKFACDSPGGNVYISLDPWYIEIDGRNGRIYLGKYIPSSFYEGWDLDVQPEDRLNIQIVVEPAAIRIRVNGQNFDYESAAVSTMTAAQVFFSPHTYFSDPEIRFREIREPFPAPAGAVGTKALEFTVDFYDDLHAAAFDHAMLDEMFQSIANFGASKAYWVHHGDRKTALWSQSVAAADKIGQSFDALGDDFLPPAVKSAHKAGLPLVGIFKPFDTAIGHYTLPLPAGQGEPDALGGRLWQIFTFPSEHPELCQRRRTAPAAQSPAAQIVIRSRRKITADAAWLIEIHVSDDNVSYRPYEGRLEIEADEYEIRISGLHVTQTFAALVFPPEMILEIQNTLPHLASVLDENGRPLEFTYGIHGRVLRLATDILDITLRQLDFRTNGIDFDCAGDAMPSGNSALRHPLINLFSLEQSRGVLGLALTCNAQVPGTLSEAEPAVHEWWLAMVEEMIESGVDGVEIRVMNHGNILDWEQYGFNEPLVREYRRRYGVDITTEEFSREKFRALRGEFFTEFLRKASALTRTRGKQFHLHIEDSRRGLASEPCPMEIEMQWRTWIEEGLCDGVTFKAIDFWSHDTAFGRELIHLCHERNVPVSYAPFIHIPLISNMRQPMLDSCMASSFDALNLYEFASLFTFNSDGKPQPSDEGMFEWLKRYPWKRPVLAGLAVGSQS